MVSYQLSDGFETNPLRTVLEDKFRQNEERCVPIHSYASIYLCGPNLSFLGCPDQVIAQLFIHLMTPFLHDFVRPSRPSGTAERLTEITGITNKMISLQYLLVFLSTPDLQIPTPPWPRVNTCYSTSTKFDHTFCVMRSQPNLPSRLTQVVLSRTWKFRTTPLPAVSDRFWLDIPNARIWGSDFQVPTAREYGNDADCQAHADLHCPA